MADGRGAEGLHFGDVGVAPHAAVTLKGRVKAGRFVVDQPTDLAEGTEVEQLPLDPGDGLDEQDRAALHKALVDSEEDVKAGRLLDAETVLRQLSRRVTSPPA